MIDPDKLPELRPGRLRFWALRLLAWTMTLGGLGLIAVGAAQGWLAYYATKNGAEVARIYQALTYTVGAIATGMLLAGVGQAFRVFIAIEENTRLIAYHTRPRAKPPEETRQKTVPAAPSDRMRL